MKLYVCWGTFPVPWPRRSGSWLPGAHPCKKAYDALKAAGHSPDVVKTYGFASLPDVTSGRKQVKRLTGESFVPVLVLDDGNVIKDSKNIMAWARDNPGSQGDHGGGQRAVRRLLESRCRTPVRQTDTRDAIGRPTDDLRFVHQWLG